MCNLQLHEGTDQIRAAVTTCSCGSDCTRLKVHTNEAVKCMQVGNMRMGPEYGNRGAWGGLGNTCVIMIVVHMHHRRSA